jgi:hypothetical protein
MKTLVKYSRKFEIKVGDLENVSISENSTSRNKHCPESIKSLIITLSK